MWVHQSNILPDVDVSTNARCTNCRGWMAAGYQMKGNIVLYLLKKYLSILTSRLSAICLWFNPCHLEMRWQVRARMNTNINVSQNARCTSCHGWMAAGSQMKGNIVFYLLTKYFSNLTSRFSAVWDSKGTGLVRVHQSNILPDLDVSTNAKCTNCRGWMAAGSQVKGNIAFLCADEIFFNFNEPF